MRNGEHAEGLQIILLHTNYRWPSGHTRKLAVASGYIESISGTFKQHGSFVFLSQGYYSSLPVTGLLLGLFPVHNGVFANSDKNIKIKS